MAAASLTCFADEVPAFESVTFASPGCFPGGVPAFLEKLFCASFVQLVKLSACLLCHLHRYFRLVGGRPKLRSVLAIVPERRRTAELPSSALAVFQELHELRLADVADHNEVVLPLRRLRNERLPTPLLSGRHQSLRDHEI